MSASLPVSRLIEDVVAMSTNALSTEQLREAKTFGDHFLRDHHLFFRIRLSDDEFADLWGGSG